MQVITCTSCDREFSRDELIRENTENIEENVSEIKEEITRDITDELRKTLKKAFSGSKNIRFK